MELTKSRGHPQGAGKCKSHPRDNRHATRAKPSVMHLDVGSQEHAVGQDPSCWECSSPRLHVSWVDSAARQGGFDLPERTVGLRTSRHLRT
jgi:hypothetical protein